MRNKRIKKINEHINYYTCHLNTSRSTISSVLRVSLCVAYELTQGKKAVQSFITKCRNEPICWIFFSHKSFAYSVKIMSVSKKTTYCFRRAVDSESVQWLAIAIVVPLYGSYYTGFIARSFIRAVVYLLSDLSSYVGQG